MTTPKVFTLNGVTKVFQSDVPIKGLDYVVAYISTTGVSGTYNIVSQSLYSLINDSIVFTVAPTGSYLRLIVGTNRSELLNSPSNIATVAVNMDAVNFAATNIDSIIDSYNVIATAQNINVISNVGNNIGAIQTNSTNIASINIVANNTAEIIIVSNDISNVNTVATNMSRVNNTGNNIDTIKLVGNSIANVNAVGNSITNVNAVRSALSNVNTVATDLLKPTPSVNIVANNMINVNLVGSNIDNVNTVATNIGSIVNKAKFKVKSDSSLLLDVKTNTKNPNLVELPNMVGFQVNLTYNSIKNVSGRDLDVIGTMAVQVNTTSTTDVFLYMYSESSLDGITWTPNVGSLREVKVNKAGVDYITVSSLLLNTKWLNNSHIRFKFYKEGTGDLTIVPITDTVNGNSISGSSFVWAIHEL